MRSRSKRPPVPKPSALQVMIQAAAPILATRGSYRSPAAPWIAAATLTMKVAQGCGWSLQDTPEAVPEPMLVHRGWEWQWLGDDLVIELPEWVKPVPVFLSIEVKQF